MDGFILDLYLLNHFKLPGFELEEEYRLLNSSMV